MISAFDCSNSRCSASTSCVLSKVRYEGLVLMGSFAAAAGGAASEAKVNDAGGVGNTFLPSEYNTSEAGAAACNEPGVPYAGEWSPFGGILDSIVLQSEIAR